MPNHEPPAFRFLIKDEGSEKLVEIGQAWKTNKKDCFSVTLDPENTGEKLKFLMVPNQPKSNSRPTAAKASDPT